MLHYCVIPRSNQDSSCSCPALLFLPRKWRAGAMSDRSRSPRRAQTRTAQQDLAEAIRIAPRAKMERCLLKCLEAGELPEDVRRNLLPQAAISEPMIHNGLAAPLPSSDFASMLREKTKFALQRAPREWREFVSADSLPSSIFGSMLCQKTKTSLQRTNREWRDVVRMPSFWRELSIRYFKGSTQELLASLEDPRFAQVESLALSIDGTQTLTLDLCRQIQQRLPRIAALDASGVCRFRDSGIDAAIEGFAPLLHLRLDRAYFHTEHLRTVLTRHEQLRVLKCPGGRLCLDLSLAGSGPPPRSLREDFPKHSALEVLSLDCGLLSRFPDICLADFPTAFDELVRRVLTKLPSLTRLFLKDWSDISKASESAVFRACPKLTELRHMDAQACPPLSDQEDSEQEDSDQEHPLARVDEWRVDREDP